MRPLSYLILLSLSVASLRADPVEATVRAKTPFKDFALAQVAKGDVLENRQGAASTPQVEAIQTCFLVKAPVAKVTSILLNWNPAGVSGLEVSFHQKLDTPVSSGTFKPELGKFLTTTHAGAWIVKQSSDKKSELMLTEAEISALAAATTPAALTDAWAKLLASRFEKRDDFNKLIGAVRAIGPVDISSPSGGSYYWEFSDVTGRGSISEGVTWQDGSRIGDGEFFVTSEYTASFDVSTLWPVKVDGHEATLVWRIDSAYSPQFESLHGAERIASSSMILSSVKKAIEAIRKKSEK